MRHEEYGKLLHLAARNGGGLSSCENAREFRLDEIRRISRLVTQVQLGENHHNGNDIFERVQGSLENLREFVTERVFLIDAQSELARFENEVSAWRRNFPLVRKTDFSGVSN